MHEGVPVDKHDIVNRICVESGLEVVDNCVDLARLSFVEAQKFLDALTKTGEFVLHGTNSNEVFKCLETRQGHCTIKESGRKKAVYSAENGLVTLAVSILNRKYLGSIEPNYSSGFSCTGDNIKFTFPEKLLDLFIKKDPQVFSDGYVYVLDKSQFINAEDAGDEWHSESNQEPLLACKISKNIAEDIYKTGTESDNVFLCGSDNH